MAAPSNPWTQIPIQTGETIWLKFAEFAPNLVGVVLIAIAGLVVALVARKIVGSVLKRTGFDKLGERVGVNQALKTAKIHLTPSQIIARLVFWMIILITLVSTADTLGLEAVSRTIDMFVAYLPNVIGAVLILVAGTFLAFFLRNFVRASGQRLNLEYADLLSSIMYWLLIVITVSLALGQLNIETALLNDVVKLVAVSVGAAAALSIGLGARGLVRDILAGVYVRDLYKSGDSITIGTQQGQVEEIGTIVTRIRLTTGESVNLPNTRLIRGRVIVDEAA